MSTSTGTGTGTGIGTGTVTGTGAHGLTPLNLYLVRIGLPDIPAEPEAPGDALAGVQLLNLTSSSALNLSDVSDLLP